MIIEILMLADMFIYLLQLDRSSAAGAYIITAEKQVQCHGHIIPKQRQVMSSSVAGEASEPENADMAHRA